MDRRNEDVARLLENVAKLLALKGESPYRVRAYREAARTISAMTEDVEDLHREGRLQDIRGVGESIASKIGEYLDTGRSSYYESLKGEVPVAAVELLAVPGIGPVRARLLHERLGIAGVADLEKAAREHKLRGLRGFGEKLERKIATEAARVVQRTRRMLLGVALPAAEEVVRLLLLRHPSIRDIDPAGSIRRMKETIGDIDILASSDHPLEVMDAFTTLPIVKEVLAKGPTRSAILTKDDLQIDIRVIKPEEYGSALLYFTGSKEHNIALRTLVMQRGWKLSEYGLFDEQERRISGRTEEEVYRTLGMDWIPPELRENRGEIDAARHHQLPQLLEPRDVKGDLHVHTDWSDGHDPPEQMVEEAIARGYQYVALTDHSKGLGVARGLSADMVRQQRRLVDRLNEFYSPFRILHGTEVNILPDGSLDYPEEVLAEFDIVTASVHSAFGQSREQMTGRILRALQNPHVDSLNHPTGRILLGRAAYEVDMEAVIRVAAENGVSLEINGQPGRLDLDDVWSHRAREAGALVVCDSDAHSVRQMEYVRYAVATARRGWVGPKDALNALSLDRLLAHLARRARQRIRAA